jgi:hypothetical protein
MTKNYNRSEIYFFYELSEANQSNLLQCYELEQLETDSFVLWMGEALPLSQFIRTDNNNFTHGVYSLSYFSGYFVTLSKCGQSCVVAYKYF